MKNTFFSIKFSLVISIFSSPKEDGNLTSCAEDLWSEDVASDDLEKIGVLQSAWEDYVTDTIDVIGSAQPSGLSLSVIAIVSIGMVAFFWSKSRI